jgi:hypothetical protein
MGVMRSFVIVFFTKCYYHDLIKENQVCRVTNVHMREVGTVYKILIRNPERKSKYRQEDLNEPEKVMDWIHLAYDTEILHHLVFVTVLAQLV